MTTTLHQINLQRHFGGGEVYTAFLCQALDRLGIATTLYVHPEAAFWRRLGLPSSTLVKQARAPEDLLGSLPHAPLWLLSHGPQPKSLVAARDRHWLLTAMAHMPLQGRNPHSYDGHDMVFPVSNWVRQGLLDVGAASWREPLYGVASVGNRSNGLAVPLVRNSRFDWDRRKARDRLLGLLQPLVRPWCRTPAFVRRPGLTLGIVSRLTPIKQFPLLFSHLAHCLALHPSVNLEVFGSGGYASVRDLDRSLAPIAQQVRFWGQQSDVRAVYAQLDFLLTGLPEKEALGLNIIEAQACDLPVLAVRAAPFIETVAEGVTGYFYRDPREDGGAEFSALLERLQGQPATLHPARATEHLARFSLDALVERLRPVVTWVDGRLSR